MIGADEISDDERRLALHCFDRAGRDWGTDFFSCISRISRLRFERSGKAGRRCVVGESRTVDF